MISDHQDLVARVEHNVKQIALPALKEFVGIPNVSRNYDKDWATNGLLRKACDFCLEYSRKLDLKGLNVEVHTDEGTTPFIFGTLDATNGDKEKTVVVYGHIDKQPPLTDKWKDGLHPYNCIERDGYLYGRGVIDDGYNWFVVFAILKAFQECGVKHDRFVFFYECDEESESKDIPHYLQKFRPIIGKDPEMMLALDTASISPEHFAIASTLRGILNFDLSVKVLDKGIHSGNSGVAPSTFRIIRQLLDRLEDSKTGKVHESLFVEIPADKLEHAKRTAQFFGQDVYKKLPLLEGVQPVTTDPLEAYLNRIWRPQLEIIGQENLPTTDVAGNVLRDETVLRCGIRLPPTKDDMKAFEFVKDLLEKDPPYNAHVSVTLADNGAGFCANPLPAHLMEIFDKRAMEFFGNPVCMTGSGGSVPFVSYLQSQLPNTFIMVSGASLPDSHIHGPNENLNIEYVIKFSKTLSTMLADFGQLNK